MNAADNARLGLQQAYLTGYPQQRPKTPPIKLRITQEPWEAQQFLVECLSHRHVPIRDVWFVEDVHALRRFDTEIAARNFAEAYLRGPTIIAEFTASEGESLSGSPAGHP